MDVSTSIELLFKLICEFVRKASLAGNIQRAVTTTIIWTPVDFSSRNGYFEWKNCQKSRVDL